MRSTIAGILLVSSLPLALHAAAPVSEIGSTPSSSTSRAPAYTPAPIPVPVDPGAIPESPVSPAVGDSFSQLQMLQDEVRTLRGMVEELNNEVRQLKARQLDDYMDLDRRISGMATGGGAVSPASGSQSGASSVSEPAATPSGGDETAHYTSAYDVLKAGKTTEAAALFKQHIERYPNGAYTANAYYWLGEIYLLQNDLEQARQAFAMVVNSYPVHRKASDATFKLGQVYHLMGDNAKAKSLLEKAAAGNDNAAKLAKSYLQQNF
ncbi:MAG: tol-pal system protein YbgF [Porticoccaceae bacterium]